MCGRITYHNFNLSHIARFHIVRSSNTIGDIVFRSASSDSLFAENVRLGIIQIRGRNLQKSHPNNWNKTKQESLTMIKTKCECIINLRKKLRIKRMEIQEAGAEIARRIVFLTVTVAVFLNGVTPRRRGRIQTIFIEAPLRVAPIHSSSAAVQIVVLQVKITKRDRNSELQRGDQWLLRTINVMNH